MSTVTGTVTGSAGPASGTLHLAQHPEETYLGSVPVVAGAFTYAGVPDDTYAVFLTGMSDGDGWVGGGGANNSSADPLVVAGDTVAAIVFDPSTGYELLPPVVPVTGSRLLVARRRILDALEAGGVHSATTGKWSAPVVLVEAGDPWAAVDLSMGRRRSARWRLTLVAGRADSEGIVERLGTLVDQVDDALLAVPGVQLPTWSQPFAGSLGGVSYACTSSTIQAMTEEAPTP